MIRRRSAAALVGAIVVLTGVGAPAAAAGSCDDLLVTHRPDGSTDAVAVTSPALELRFCGERTAPGTIAEVGPTVASGTPTGRSPATGAGASSLALGVFGAATGLLVGGVVLLLSRAARSPQEVAG